MEKRDMPSKLYQNNIKSKMQTNFLKRFGSNPRRELPQRNEAPQH